MYLQWMFIASLAISPLCAQSPVVGIWSFDASSGLSAADSSGRGNHGALRNFTSSPAQWVPGRFGNALSFDGIDDVVDITANSGLPFFTGRGEDFSICLWVRAAPAADRRILVLSRGASPSPLFALGSGRSVLGTADRLALLVLNSQGIASTRTSSLTVFDGTWHHVAYVESGGYARLYVDGGLDSSSFDDRFGARGARTGTYGDYAFDTVSIGASAATCCPFAGALDELQVYETALTQADVAAIFGGATASAHRTSIGEFGVGCGPGPLELSTLGSPAIGGRGIAFSMRGGVPGGIALLGISLGPVAPIDLSGFGFAGCAFQTANLEFFAFGVCDATGGITSAMLEMPTVPSLDGSKFVLQGATVGVTGVALSQAVLANIGMLTNQQRRFDFQNDALLDRAQSSGTWGGGSGMFAELGGDGSHGEFALEDGQQIAASHWRFSTDSQSITAKPSTASATNVTVTDGRFFFSRFVVPAGVTVEFVGSNPLRLHVCGECRIDGTVLGAGKAPDGSFSIKAPVQQSGPWSGQAGASGGPGGGAGGRGAYGCDGTGNPTQPQFNFFNGYDGEALQVPAGHALSAAVGVTPGRGARLFPAHGNQSVLTYPAFGIINVDTSAGAGGGGFVTAGGTGSVTRHGSVNGVPSPNPAYMGPPTSGGQAVSFGTPPAGVNSSEYYLVGGSGGGGGASHPLFALSGATADPLKYRSGAAGAGGGGTLRLRVGGSLAIAPSALLDFRGGSALSYTPGAAGEVPGLGAGGSGGTILIQAAGARATNGTIDVRGGAGGSYSPAIYSVQVVGGAGGDGFVRVETPGSAPSLPSLGTMQPPAVAASAGVLMENDDRSAFQSMFVSSGTLAPPVWVRYVIAADVDNVPRVFSDDPALGPPAREGQAPLVFLLQGANVDLSGQLLAEPRLTAWQSQVGPFDPARGSLDEHARNGFRWRLALDRTMAVNVVVHEVRIEFRN